MSSAGLAPEAIFSRLYLADKTRYPRPLCSIQYMSIDAAKLTRITGVPVWFPNGRAVNL